jgi:hypothetical protein
MRTLAFCILHSGRPYLRYAIESIIDQVDKVVILYTPTPSQGFQADVRCPDGRDNLRDLAFRSAKKNKSKLEWVDGAWPNESEHVNAIWPYSKGYDWVWRFDADEVSPPGMVAEMIRQAQDTTDMLFRVPFVHFWRSFSRVCRDGSHPFRLFRMKVVAPTLGGQVYLRAEGTLDSKGGQWEVLHFGYAQPTRYITYKMQVSGHRPEWRTDWFKDRWLANAQADVHPVIYPTHWMPEDYDKSKLPDVLKKHPYWGMEVIE